jgi:hypothetical protein
VDEVATAIGQYNLDGAYEFNDADTYTYPGPSRAGRKPKSTDAANNAGRDLFARVSGGPQGSSSSNVNGRLRENDQPSSSRDQGFSFKGAGAGKAEPGFSILGASESNGNGSNNRERGANLAKELFPHRAGANGNGRSEAPNGGRDLFDGRIKGRARKRAEDLF